MKLVDLVNASEEVARVRSRTAKIERLSRVLEQAAPEELLAVVGFLSGEPRQGRIGVGGALLRRLHGSEAASATTLDVLTVDGTFSRIAEASGKGAGALRERLLGELFQRMTEPEQSFVARLLAGALRQGALEGVLIDALALASKVPAGELRRALLFSGNLGEVGVAALTGGAPALARFSLSLFRPLRPMLADTAEDVEDALTRCGASALEYKLDGARVQVHRQGREVRVYSRLGNDVTESVPEIRDSALELPGRELVLDGEAIALDDAGRPLPFQTTMRRFGRRLNVSSERPLTTAYFDILHVDGVTLVDRENRERAEILEQMVPQALRVPRRTVEGLDGLEATNAFFDAALAAGHEGLLVKSLSAGYDAGRRGSGWLKLKRAHTLDLVVLAIEWGSGRRRGLLSNLHLGARDPEHGGFVMLGKTFKGMTDEMLAWQTEKFLSLKTEEQGHVVFVRPEIVVEIAFDGVQASSQYSGGLALRFARVKRYRPDKSVLEADTIQTVRALFEQSRAG